MVEEQQVNNKEQQKIKKLQVTIGQSFLWLTDTIFHQLVTVTAGFIFYTLIKNNDLTSTRFLHYFLSAGAYIPLMAEGFSLFSETNTYTVKLRRTKKAWIHGALLAISTICASIGMGVEVHSKNQHPRPEHFKSNHAILGLVSWILCLVSVIVGLFALYSQTLKRFVRPVVLKSIHTFFGLACYIIGVSSLILGLQKGGFKRFVTDNELNVTTALVIIVTVWSVIVALISLFNNLKTIFTQ